MTRGHEENFNYIKSLADIHNCDHLIIVSHKTNSSKNPLKPKVKLNYLKQIFPNLNFVLASRKRPTLYQFLEEISKLKYETVFIASGSDRVEDFKKIRQYNGRLFHFKNMLPVSTGNRGLVGAHNTISGTKQRQRVVLNDFIGFIRGCPSCMSIELMEKLFKELRKVAMSSRRKSPRNRSL